MPNPLSLVHPSPQPNFDDSALEPHSELAAQVVRTLAAWAKLDSAFGYVFSRLMADESEKGAAIYNALISVNAQDAALDAVATMVLNRDDLDVFLAIKSISKAPRDQRNMMAHGIWGSCKQVVDGILLLPPRELTRFVERVDCYVDRVNSKAGRAPGDKMPDVDLSQVMVYRLADFRAIQGQIKAAHDSWALFRCAALGSWTLTDLAPAEARRRLLAQPEIRAKIDKARLNRGEPPLPPA